MEIKKENSGRQKKNRRFGSESIGTRIYLALAVAMTISTAGTASATEISQKSTMWGAKAGIISSGEVTAGSRTFDSETSYSIGTFVDYRLAPKLTGGLTLDYNDMGQASVTEGGFLLKALVESSSGLQYRPIFGLGVGTDETASYLTVKMGLELLVPHGNRGVLLEASLYAAPAGGNEAVDITYGPMLQLRGGIAY